MTAETPVPRKASATLVNYVRQTLALHQQALSQIVADAIADDPTLTDWSLDVRSGLWMPPTP